MVMEVGSLERSVLPPAPESLLSFQHISLVEKIWFHLLYTIPEKSQRTIRSPLAFSLLRKSDHGLCSDVLCSSPNHLGDLHWTYCHPSLSVLYWEPQTQPSAQLWSCKCQTERRDPCCHPPSCGPARTVQDAVDVITSRVLG